MQQQSLLNSGAEMCDRGFENSSMSGITMVELMRWQRDGGGPCVWWRDDVGLMRSNTMMSVKDLENH